MPDSNAGGGSATSIYFGRQAEVSNPYQFPLDTSVHDDVEDMLSNIRRRSPYSSGKERDRVKMRFMGKIPKLPKIPSTDEIEAFGRAQLRGKTPKRVGPDDEYKDGLELLTNRGNRFQISISRSEVYELNKEAEEAAKALGFSSGMVDPDALEKERAQGLTPSAGGLSPISSNLVKPYGDNGVVTGLGHKPVGFVWWKISPTTIGVGSGAMFGPKHVVTAAHTSVVVVPINQNAAGERWAYVNLRGTDGKWHFELGKNGTSVNASTDLSLGVYLPTAWCDLRSIGNDPTCFAENDIAWGGLRTAPNQGWFSATTTPDLGNLQLSGAPGTMWSSTPGTDCGPTNQLGGPSDYARLYEYSCRSFGGISGGPLWFNYNGGYYINGVHSSAVYFGDDWHHSLGAGITNGKFDQMMFLKYNIYP